MNTSALNRLVHMVVFELNEKEYGIPVTSIKEVIKVGEFVEIPNAPEFIAGVINLRGNIICVIDLRKQFGFPSNLTDRCRIMVVRMRNMIVGIIVDVVHEVLKVPKNQIDPVPRIVNIQLPGNAMVGIAKANNRIITLINLENVLSGEQIARMSPDALQ